MEQVIQMVVELTFDEFVEDDYRRVAEHLVTVERRGKEVDWSDAELAMYQDMIWSVEDTVQSFFPKLSGKQGNGGVSCYYYFDVTRKDDSDPTILEVVFRVSNHQQENNNAFVEKKVRVFRSYVLDGKQYQYAEDLVLAVSEYCSDLKRRGYGQD